MIVEDTARERVRFADVGGGIEIAYESFGDPSDPTILLVMGLGMQMLGWDEGFCELLVDRGYRVVRYDNRDIGLSTKVGGGTPNVRRRRGRPHRLGALRPAATWPPTRSGSSTTSRSSGLTSSEPRWAG